MTEMFRRRPWLLVVFALAFVVAINIVFVIIAVMHPPTLLKP